MRSHGLFSRLAIVVVVATLLNSNVSITSAAGTPVAFSFAPVPIATHASLTAGISKTVTVTARDGSGAPIPGATIYLDFFPTAAPIGGTPGAVTAQGQSVATTARPFTADGNGQVAVTYTPGTSTSGADLVRAKDAATSPLHQSNDSYCYNPGDMLIRPSPLAVDNSMLAGAVSGGTVTVVDAAKSPVPGGTVWLAVAGIGASFPSIFLDPMGTAKAKSASGTWVSLTKTPQAFVAESNGQVPFYYRTPTLLPADKTDAIVAQDKSTRGCIKTSHYDFGAIPAGTRTDRLAGQDRYNTAAAISGTYQAPGTSDTVFVATGLNYPDALAGAAVAGRAGDPVLLVSTTAIPTTTANQLSRLRPRHIVILGGTSVVSSSVETQLRSYALDVQRYGGTNRYDTARLIAQHYFPGGAATVFVATGLNFPDALAGAAVAGSVGGPILLVDGRSSLPPATSQALSALHPQHIIIFGGTSVVPTWTANQLRTYTSDVQRYAGTDRYGTGAAVANHFYATGANIAFVATGLNFPDALTGAAPAGTLGAPILLVAPTSVPPTTLSSLRDVVNPHSIVVLGGTSAVSDSVKNQLGALIP